MTRTVLSLSAQHVVPIILGDFFRTIPKVTASDKPTRLRLFLSCPKLSQPSVTRKPLFVTMSRTPLSGDAYKRKEKRTEVWLGCGK